MQNEDYIFTEKDTKNWQMSKSQIPTEIKKLSKNEINVFLELVSSLASPVLFERKLGLSRRDVEHYKRVLQVDDQESARKILKKIKIEQEQEQMARIEAARVESIARAEEINKRSNEVVGVPKKSIKQKSKAAIKKEQAKRQKRLDDQNNALRANSNFRCESPKDFEHDLARGMNFCCKKYNVQPSDIYAEIHRLALDINIDNIRR